MIQSAFSRISSYENSIDVWNGVRGGGDHEGICEQECSLTHDSKVFWKWYVVIYVLCYEFIKSRSVTLALGVCYCYRQNISTLYLYIPLPYVPVGHTKGANIWKTHQKCVKDATFYFRQDLCLRSWIGFVHLLKTEC